MATDDTPKPDPAPARDTAPVLPDRTSDETDVGWGGVDRGSTDGSDAEPFADDDVRRLLEDLPPHHVDRDL